MGRYQGGPGGPKEPGCVSGWGQLVGLDRVWDHPPSSGEFKGNKYTGITMLPNPNPGSLRALLQPLAAFAHQPWGHE